VLFFNDINSSLWYPLNITRVCWPVLYSFH